MARTFRRISVGVAPLLAVLLLSSVAGCPPSDNRAPGNVTSFQATPSDSAVALSWSNPSDSDFAGVRIVRGTDGYPASPTDGTTVYEGTGDSAEDTSLTNGVEYFYTAFTYDAVPNYSTGAQASAIPTAASASSTIIEHFESVEDTLEDADIPEDEREALDQALTNAESSYRGGDPCEAATHLRTYATLAQGFRQTPQDPTHVREYEGLYAIGRLLRYEMVAGLPAKDLCTGEERVDTVATQTVDDDHNSNTEFQAVATFGEPILLPIKIGEDVFTQVTIPGCDNKTGPPGRPAVPMFRRVIAVPHGAQVQVECDTSDAETVFVNLLPTQRSPVDQGTPGPAPAPSFFANQPFTIDETLYETNALYPAENCRIQDLGELRDYQAYLIEIPAAQYNPQTDAMTLFGSASIRATFEGGAGSFATEAVSSQFESNRSLYDSIFSNFEAVRDHLSVSDIVANLGAELLILTPPALRAPADELADWKGSKGISTRVFEIGSGTTIDTSEEIVDLIKNEYENARVRPSYVLLLGNTIFIPTNYVAPNGDVGADMIGTDYPYAAFGRLGILPKLAIGRLPVANLTDANTVVDRIIAYESDPPTEDDFYNHVSIASQFQCCMWETFSLESVGTDQRTFIQSAEFARNVMLADGRTVDRIYTETVDPLYEFDTEPRRYPDGTSLPADLGAGSGFAWDADTADVVSAFNAGRFLFIHRDHGWPGGWANPLFDWFDASGLTNGNELSFVISMNCASGLFDEQTAGGALGTMPGVSYFAERILTNPLGGAIGMLGDTRNSPTWANTELFKGFIDAIWPNAIADFGDGTAHRRIGDILNHGKLYLLGQASTAEGAQIDYADVADEFRMWHCLGDPTLELWTENPTLEFLVPFADLRRLGESAWTLDYDIEGASLTAFRFDNGLNALLPLGRGTVQGGTANLELLGQLQQGESLLVAASLPNRIAGSFEVLVPDSTPPGNVLAFTATVPNLIRVVLAWHPPASPDYAGVRIQRRTDTHPTSPSDGITVYEGNGTTHNDDAVANHTTYYYTAFAYDTSGNFASGVSADANIFLLTKTDEAR